MVGSSLLWDLDRTLDRDDNWLGNAAMDANRF
jgi:hypothetical protein